MCLVSREAIAETILRSQNLGLCRSVAMRCHSAISLSTCAAVRLSDELLCETSGVGSASQHREPNCWQRGLISIPPLPAPGPGWPDSTSHGNPPCGGTSLGSVVSYGTASHERKLSTGLANKLANSPLSASGPVERLEHGNDWLAPARAYSAHKPACSSWEQRPRSCVRAK